MTIRVGQIYRGRDSNLELEITGYNSSTGEFRYILDDGFGKGIGSDTEENLQTLIDLDEMYDTHVNALDKVHCRHHEKEKKLCFNLYYWVCKSCGKEFNNE